MTQISPQQWIVCVHYRLQSVSRTCNLKLNGFCNPWILSWYIRSKSVDSSVGSFIDCCMIVRCIFLPGKIYVLPRTDYYSRFPYEDGRIWKTWNRLVNCKIDFDNIQLFILKGLERTSLPNKPFLCCCLRLFESLRGLVIQRLKISFAFEMPRYVFAENSLICPGFQSTRILWKSAHNFLVYIFFFLEC